LTWDPVPGAASYTIFRGTTIHGETTYTTGVTSHTFLNTRVSSGIVYYYQVAAVDASGTGPRSNEAASSTTSAVAIPTTTPVPTHPAQHASSPSSHTGLIVIVLIVLAVLAGSGGVLLWLRGTGGISAAQPTGQPLGNSLPAQEIFPGEDEAGFGGQIATTPTNPSMPGVATAGRLPRWPIESPRPSAVGDQPLPTGAIIALVMIVLGVAGIVAFAILTIFNQPGNATTLVASQTATPVATIAPAPTATSTASPTATPVAGSGGIAISAGGDQVGNFVADTDYSGGLTDSTQDHVDTGGVTDPAPEKVYQSERWGAFTYTIPNLTPGASYLVRLHFAEIYFSQPGQREFNVSINGQMVLQNFDIVVAAGGPRRAVIEQFTFPADANGQIVIAFTTGPANFPKVSGIEIIPAS
jgi:hypothetical protein